MEILQILERDWETRNVVDSPSTARWKTEYGNTTVRYGTVSYGTVRWLIAVFSCALRNRSSHVLLRNESITGDINDSTRLETSGADKCNLKAESAICEIRSVVNINPHELCSLLAVGYFIVQRRDN